MKITKIKPQGYCFGVLRSLKMVEDTLTNKKPIYILGMIIHNKEVNKRLEEKGVIVLKGSSPLEMIKTINEGTVVITAHGADEKVFLEGQKKGLSIIDATCPNVKAIHQMIKEKLASSYHIIYIGKKGHPETEAILSLGNIYLYNDNLPDLSGKIFLTCQTTLSADEVAKSSFIIKEKYPMVEECLGICDATLKRQEAVLKHHDLDLCYVVGDKESSNACELVRIANKVTKGLLIESFQDIKEEDLANVSHIGITSASSTPSYLVDEVINYLNSIKKNA